MESVKVAIVAERLWQEALANLIKPDTDLMVATSVDRTEDIVAEPVSTPDVVLIDFDSPQIKGEECIIMVKNTFPEAVVIGVASRITPVRLVSMIEAGIAGALLKTCTAEQIIRAIKHALSGQAVIELRVLQSAIQQLIKLPKQLVNGDGELTAQELKIIQLTARGLCNKEVAKHLSISERTVCSHFRNIFEKFEIHSRLEAVLLAQKSGWISEQC